MPQVLHGNSGSSQHKSVTLLWSHHQCDIIIIDRRELIETSYSFNINRFSVFEFQNAFFKSSDNLDRPPAFNLDTLMDTV